MVEMAGLCDSGCKSATVQFKGFKRLYILMVEFEVYQAPVSKILKIVKILF